MACGTKIIIKKPNHTHVAADITDFGHAVTNIIDATVLNGMSANWIDTYYTVSSLSASWANIPSDTAFVRLSGGTMTGGLSSPSLSCDTLYVGSNTIFFVNSANQVVNYFNSNDVSSFRSLTASIATADWNSVYSIVNANSALNWNYQGTDIKSLTAGWRQTTVTMSANSALNWNYQGTDIKALTGNWQRATTVVNTNSAAWGTGGSGAGLTLFKEFSSTINPNDVVSVVGLSAIGASGAIDIVIMPKASGSLLAQIPDNTIVGGNKRGLYAFDFQRTRSIATQVASGPYSIIMGGAYNTALGNYAAVLAGHTNTVNSDYGLILAGISNSLYTSSYGTVVNGSYNTISNSSYGVVLNGEANLINNTSYGVILNGSNHTILGARGLIGNGTNNYINSQFATILNGSYNITQGGYTTILGGYNNSIVNTTTYSTILDGFYNAVSVGSFVTVLNSKGAVADRWGMTAKTTYSFGPYGDCQNIKLQLYTLSTSNNAAYMTLDGVVYDDSVHRRIVPDNKIFNGIIKVIGVDNFGNYTSVIRQTIIQNDTYDTILQNSVIGTDTLDAGSVSFTTVGGYFVIRVTGIDNVNAQTRWTASIDGDEITPYITPIDQYDVYDDCAGSGGYKVYTAQGAGLVAGVKVYSDKYLNTLLVSTSFVYNSYIYTIDVDGQISSVTLCISTFVGSTDCLKATPLTFYSIYGANPISNGTQLFTDTGLTTYLLNAQFQYNNHYIETDANGNVYTVADCFFQWNDVYANCDNAYSNVSPMTLFTAIYQPVIQNGTRLYYDAELTSPYANSTLVHENMYYTTNSSGSIDTAQVCSWSFIANAVSCGTADAETFYRDTLPIDIGTQIFTDAALTNPYNGSAQLYRTGANQWFTLVGAGIISAIYSCST